MYETHPRFTLDAKDTSADRPSLAVRFRKTLGKTLPSTRGARRLVQLENEVLITGSSSFLLGCNRKHPIQLIPLKPSLQDLASIAVDGHTWLSVTDSGVRPLRRDLTQQSGVPCLEETIQLDRSYTHLIYDIPSQHYIGASAIPVPYHLYSDECELIPDPDDPNLTPPRIERSTLELFEPETWKVVDGYDFDENEVILCVESVVLEATSVPKGQKRFVAVGTSVNRGEDMSGKGNTYIFEVVPVVDIVQNEFGDGDSNLQSTTSHRLRLICSEEGFSPISAIANLGTYIIQAMGQKVFVKALDMEDRLVAVAFLDVGAFVTSIKTLKNLILLGDFVKSVWFCAFQEDPFKIEVLSRDLQDASTVSVDFLTAAEGHKASFVCTDREGVCRVLEFDPDRECLSCMILSQRHILISIIASRLQTRCPEMENVYCAEPSIICDREFRSQHSSRGGDERVAKPTASQVLRYYSVSLFGNCARFSHFPC